MSPDGATHLNLWRKHSYLPVVVIFILTPIIARLRIVKVCFDEFCFPLVIFFSTSVLIGYFVIGYFIDPDADLVGMSSADGRMMNKIPILGILFVMWWTGYGAIFRTKHRSFWTHSYIFSTFLRFIWGFWWSFWFFRELLGIYVISGVFVGMCLADGVHIWADHHYGGK